MDILKDNTQINVGSESIWLLWVAIEQENKDSRNKHIKREKYVCCRVFSIVYHGEYGKHPVSTDVGTWYPQAC